jgi:hypothetical protein
LSFSGKWRELENIILSEVIQAQNATSHLFSLICELKTYYKCSNRDRAREATKNFNVLTVQ